MKIFMLVTVAFMSSISAQAADTERLEAFALAALGKSFALLIDKGIGNEEAVERAFRAMQKVEPYLSLARLNPKAYDRSQIYLIKTFLSADQVTEINKIYPQLLVAWRQRGFVSRPAEQFVEQPMPKRIRRRILDVGIVTAVNAAGLVLDLVGNILTLGAAPISGPTAVDLSTPTNEELRTARAARGLGQLLREMDCGQSLKI